MRALTGLAMWLRGLRLRTQIVLGVAALLVFVSLLPGDPGESDAEAAPPAAAATSAPAAEPAQSAQTVDAAAAEGTESASATPSETTPSMATVPTLKGLYVNTAEKRLAKAGLKLAKVTYKASNKAKGTILSQGSKSGSRLKPGTAVTVVVAEPLPVLPRVTGRSEASARAALSNAGFKVTRTYKTVRSGSDGVVLSQSPRGARALPGATITIVVADLQAPPPAAAPQPLAQRPSGGNCTPGYSPCLPPAPDYDCSGGSGNGPA